MKPLVWLALAAGLAQGVGPDRRQGIAAGGTDDDFYSTIYSIGSWGDEKMNDIYLRYHSTWTAIDGLRDYKWKGRR